MLTRLDMHLHRSQKTVKMLERSLYSTKHVFVENSRKCGLLNELEVAVLNEVFTHMQATQDLEVDLFGKQIVSKFKDL